jgi:DNA-binding FadR family transcriptional regulator
MPPFSDRLPSENQLSRKLSVSLMTARKALDEIDAVTWVGYLIRGEIAFEDSFYPQQTKRFLHINPKS